MTSSFTSILNHSLFTSNTQKHHSQPSPPSTFFCKLPTTSFPILSLNTHTQRRRFSVTASLKVLHLTTFIFLFHISFIIFIKQCAHHLFDEMFVYNNMHTTCLIKFLFKNIIRTVHAYKYCYIYMQGRTRDFK